MAGGRLAGMASHGLTFLFISKEKEYGMFVLFKAVIISRTVRIYLKCSHYSISYSTMELLQNMQAYI